MSFLDALRRLTSSLGLLTEAQGCTEEEIAVLERQVGRALPATYREFLAWMGHDSGGALIGTDVRYASLLASTRPYDLADSARELLADFGLSPLPEDAFVFIGHHGYQVAWFRLSEGDDPTVWYLLEGTGLSEEGPLSRWLARAIGGDAYLVEAMAAGTAQALARSDEALAHADRALALARTIEMGIIESHFHLFYYKLEGHVAEWTVEQAHWAILEVLSEEGAPCVVAFEADLPVRVTLGSERVRVEVDGQLLAEAEGTELEQHVLTLRSCGASLLVLADRALACLVPGAAFRQPSILSGTLTGLESGVDPV